VCLHAYVCVVARLRMFVTIHSPLRHLASVQSGSLIRRLTSLPYNGCFPSYSLSEDLCGRELDCATDTLNELLQLVDQALHTQEISFSSEVLDALLKKLHRQASLEQVMRCTHGSPPLRFEAGLLKVQEALVARAIPVVKQHLKKLLATICSVNLPLLRLYLEQGTQQAEKARGKDLVIFVGNTGAGKSTAILHIAGVTFEKRHSGRMLSHFFSKEGMTPDMESFVTAPDARSITQFINILQLPGSGLCLCDTPGFADTRSPEIDISNGLNTVKALHNAKSVRLVVVCACSAVTDERARLIKHLLATLASLVPEAPTHKESIAFLFTRVGDDITMERLNYHLQDVRENLSDNEGRDESYKALLDRAIQSTGDGSAILLGPQKLQSGDHRQALEVLSSLKCITNPQDVFQKVRSSTSYERLQRQLELHMDAIRVACGDCATSRDVSWNVCLLLHRLNDLRDLGSYMENDAQLKRTYEDACEVVCSRVQSLTRQIMDELLVDAPFTEERLGACIVLFRRLGEVKQSSLLKVHLSALDGNFDRCLKLLWETQSTLLKQLQNWFAALLAKPSRHSCVLCSAQSRCDGELSFDFKLPIDAAIDAFRRLGNLERYFIVHVQEWLTWPGGAQRICVFLKLYGLCIASCSRLCRHIFSSCHRGGPHNSCCCQ
jgi:hypothetical protein